jgi:predicted phage terminase large subunit-like protein
MSNYEPLITRYLKTVRSNKYIPHEPTDKQALFLLHDHIPEILYGGSAGGGKSDALLMAALQYVDIPGYAALIFRRTYKDLALPDAIMDRSHQWLEETDAKWHDDQKTWIFPSGATITFGYLDSPRDHYRYQSSAFQFCAFDELTQFKEYQYLYLHSRLRRLTGSDIPIRMRAASNPGDIGHEWVKTRFVSAESRTPGCMFIPATLEDNPHLDRESYVMSLMKLDPITREQLLSGNWEVRPEGGLFKREWLKLADEKPPRYSIPLCRYWDKAATEGGGDWTAGALVGLMHGRAIVVDMKRVQSSPAGVENLIQQTAKLDGQEVMIRMEQEPGSAGVDVIDHYARRVLVGYNFKGIKSTGAKVSRAAALSTAAEQGNLSFVIAAWTSVCIDELVLFPTEGVHDDQVDAISGAYNALAQGARNPANEPSSEEAIGHGTGSDTFGMGADDSFFGGDEGLGELW